MDFLVSTVCAWLVHMSCSKLGKFLFVPGTVLVMDYQAHGNLRPEMQQKVSPGTLFRRSCLTCIYFF